MKKCVFLILLVVNFLSCNNDTFQKDFEHYEKVKGLNRTIDSLNNVIRQMNRIQVSRSFETPQKKYAFVVIDISVPLMNYDTRDEIHLTEYKAEKRVSNILEIAEFTKENEQKFIDGFQEKVVFDASPRNIRIKKRKCYSFESYEQASIEREKLFLDN